MAESRTRTYLFGAGASMDAGLPNAKDLMKGLYESIKRSAPELARAIDVAIGGLRQRAAAAGSPFAEVDFEDVLAALRLISERDQSLLAPFVGSWSAEVVSATKGRMDRAAWEFADTLSDGLRTVLEGVLEQRSGSGRRNDGSSLNKDAIGSALERALLLARDGTDDVFAGAGQAMVAGLSEVLWVRDPERVAYLAPLVARAAHAPLWIATLNYDNTVELASQAAGTELDTGIEHAPDAPPRFKEQSPVCLAKLHGSLNWHDDRHGRLISSRDPARTPTLIAGAGNKLRIDGPFLDLLFLFRNRLERSDELVCCGYSFRDTHLNHLLLSWLIAKPDRHLVVVDPFLSLEQIEDNVRAALPTGWNIVRGRLAEQVQIEAARTSEWLATVR